MGIQFSGNDWDRIKKAYTRWWNGELDRPLIPVHLKGRDPGRPMPHAPLLQRGNCTDLSIPAKELIDRIDYELSTYEFLGDAYPVYNLDSFGPGVVAAFLGAKMESTTDTVWFHPKEILPISELHFEYDGNNIWLNRIKEICYEGMKRWQGQVLVTMPDLGGTLDILSTFRPSENLLLDLYDEPEEVKRLVWEIHELWWKYYQEINSVLQPLNPGYSDWARIYSATPSYVLQCDFSYMISPQFFDEFVKPELYASCKKLDHSLYHLDGIGELNHLDSILAMPELDAVQWVPGDGKPPQAEWPDVMRRIAAAGKKQQILGPGMAHFDQAASILGTAKGLEAQGITGNVEQKKEIMESLKKYRVI